MPSTTIPAAISGFLSQCQAAVPAGTGVYDGIVRVGQSTASFVAVTGWVSDERAPATFGATPGFFTLEEHYEIQGFIRCLEGSEDQTVSRGQAFAVWDAIEQAVRADPTLGGAVRVSWLRRQEGIQGANEGARGNGTQITFELHCEARI